MISELLAEEDLFLILVELTIAIGLLIVCYLVIKIKRDYPKLTEEGWTFIVIGMISLLLHALFDALDTLDFMSITNNEAQADFINDILNLLDGSGFLLGIMLLSLGIYKIADYGAKVWEIE